MKNIKLFVALAGIIGMLSSCKKNFLDTKVDTYSTPETVITDRNSLFQFANAFYAAMPYGFTALDNNLFAPATDEAYQTLATAQNVRPFNQGTLSPVNPANLDNVYKNLYDGIRAANFFLNYSTGYREFLLRNRDTTSASAIIAYQNDSLNIAWFRGEAHIARAFYYAELINRFGGVPLISTVFSPNESTPVAKKSYEEVVEFIVSEIDTYKDSVQLNWKTSNFKGNDGRFSRGSALALKARLLLYAASPLHTSTTSKWQRAAEAFRDVMVLPGLNLGLYTGGYRNLFLGSTPTASGTNEVILAVRRPAGNNPEVNNYPIGTPGGNSGITPSNNLVSAYEYIGTPDPANPYANRDPRLAATVVTIGSTWNGRVIDASPGGTDDRAKSNTSRTGYYLKKFLTDNLNLTQGGTAQHNWIVFRYAEILLGYAEAMNEAFGADVQPAGYPMTARQALTMVRNRASTLLPVVTASSVADFRAAVKQERRVELAFEDHRYWDLLRWKDAEIVLNQPITGVTVTKNPNNTFNYQTITVAARAFRNAMYLFPFTQAEISNSKGTLEQNPGY
ncbi:MAG: RagB/SusD family nutrient uptake outer membrane protein [Citrobacter freundii]|nr:MAG: RagB/SusD family nutrient uptake outer membrane protein [Citrobacter freundii]